LADFVCAKTFHYTRHITRKRVTN